jgi:hypothetical protein
VILGASFNDVTKNAAFAEKYDFPYPLLCDTDRKLGLAYGAAADAGAGHAARVGVLVSQGGRPRLPPAGARRHPGLSNAHVTRCAMSSGTSRWLRRQPETAMRLSAGWPRRGATEVGMLGCRCSSSSVATSRSGARSGICEP